MAFRFDEAKDFGANLESFLAHLETDDPEMGAILRVHVQHLLSATDDLERREGRGVFNFGVTLALDELLAKMLEGSR